MADDGQRAQWMAMRRLATGLLLLMALLLLLAHRYESRHVAWSFIAAFAEAALVGGLADWFAVTALFRHPLGLPVPHTAIIPAHKERLADSIAGFIKKHFFTPAVIAEELSRIDFASAVSDALMHPRRRRRLAQQLLRSLATLSSLNDNAQVRQSARDLRDALLTPSQVAHIAAALLSAMITQQRHVPLFNRMLVMLTGLLDDNQWLIYQKVFEKTPAWMPRYLKEEIFRRLMTGLQELLDDMQQPDSPWRDGFTASLQAEVKTITTDVAIGQALRAQLIAALSEPAVGAALRAGWGALLAGQRTGEAAAAKRLQTCADQLMAAVVTAWAQDAPRRDAFNRQVRRRLARLLLARRSRLLDVIRRVMRDWDAATVAGAVESSVGRDLQYIRMNGTLVGGTVGVLLFILQKMF